MNPDPTRVPARTRRVPGPAPRRRASRAIAALAIALASCSSTPLRYYTVAAPPGSVTETGTLAGAGVPATVTRAEPGTAWIAVAPIDPPEAIDRAELTFRDGPNRLRLLPDARWAEPLRGALARALASALERRGLPALAPGSPLADEASARLTVALAVLDVGADGSVALSADWLLAGLPAAGTRSASGRLRVRIGPGGDAAEASEGRGVASPVSLAAAASPPAGETIAAAYARAIDALATEIARRAPAR